SSLPSVLGAPTNGSVSFNFGQSAPTSNPISSSSSSSSSEKPGLFAFGQSSAPSVSTITSSAPSASLFQFGQSAPATTQNSIATTSSGTLPTGNMRGQPPTLTSPPSMFNFGQAANYPMGSSIFGSSASSVTASSAVPSLPASPSSTFQFTSTSAV